MPKLFKDKVIREKLQCFEIPDMQAKLATVQKWHSAYISKELHKKTETQCEQSFNQDFFVEILGFRAFPNEIYTIDPKAKTDATGQKPDALLGYFTGNEKVVTAVAEIKDVNTALDRSQRREGNLSPVQQAFKYKPQYKSCAFVIATNFFEIRLHKDNQLDYEQFTLASLLDPKDDYFQFRKFYFLLCERNFVSRTGKSVTEGLLSEINSEQDKITKSFYKEYKELRQELIRSIVKNNQKARDRRFFETLAIEKAQKLIDRIVFVCFCEDLGLLPEDSLKKAITYAESGFVEMPLWEVLKAFFEGIDKGSDRLQIPEGYNGELFKPDKDLDELVIEAEVLRNLADLGHFDFSEDLSVNILGHIFEQSIADIERLKALTKEEAAAETDRKKSKRKSDGIFYTPDYITDYIVKNSLGAWLREREEAILERHKLKKEINDKNYDKRALAAFEEYQKALQGVKVLDPACGSGAFLVKVFDFLLAENRRVADILTDLRGGGRAKLFESEQAFKEILHNNIYGVDLNPESVEITKLSLWLKSAQKGKKLANLSGNIKCGNSLVDDAVVAGDRAFQWSVEFPEVMQTGGFDVIVGNPPYVRAELLTPYRWYFSQHYTVFNKASDLFSYFYEKALALTKTGGFFGYISNAFDKTAAGENLRRFIQTEAQIMQYIDFKDINVFEGITTYPVIIIAKKQKTAQANFPFIKVSAEQNRGATLIESQTPINMEQQALNPVSWEFVSKAEALLQEKLTKQYPTIKEKYGKCFYGVKTGLNEAFIILDKQAKKLEQNHLVPIYEGKQIKKWHTPEAKQKLILFKAGDTLQQFGSDIKKSEVETILSGKYPAIFEHLKEYKEKAQIRYDQGDCWWELRKCAYYELFEKPKIIFPNLQNNNKFSFDESGTYLNAPAVFLPTEDKALLGILNSKVVWYFLKSVCVVRSGGYIEVKPQYFEQIPIPDFDEQRSGLNERVETIIELKMITAADIMKFSNALETEFQQPLKSVSIFASEFVDFQKTIKVKDLSLSKKADLQAFFEEYKGKIFGKEQRIKKLEQEIDEIVYGLYKFAEEEKSLLSRQ